MVCFARIRALSGHMPGSGGRRRRGRLRECSRIGTARNVGCMRDRPTVRDVWLAFVVAGLRSKFGAAALALMLAVAGWQLANGHTRTGLVVLGIAVATYARVPAAIGAALAARQERRNH